jgi:polysaccharide pyruvyl transferase WcaK-like protein
MMEALEKGLPSCNLVAVTQPATERRLESLRLSGRGFFAGLVVSGGTLINQYFLRFLETVAEPGMPAWTIGTGVGSPGFGTPEAVVTLAGWVEVLERFVEVTVRGPRSSARLAQAGFPGAVPIGDLALAHTPETCGGARHSRALFVNVSGMEKERAHGEGLSEAAVIRGVARAVNALSRDGWKPVPLEMHREDVAPLDELGRRIGGWRGDRIAPMKDADVSRVMASAGAVIGMRLHAAVLGWTHGIPTIGLAYRDKTIDCAEQLDARDQVVDLRTADERGLEEGIRHVVARPAEDALAVHDRARRASVELHQLMRRIDTHLSERLA